MKEFKKAEKFARMRHYPDDSSELVIGKIGIPVPSRIDITRANSLVHKINASFEGVVEEAVLEELRKRKAPSAAYKVAGKKR
jgi:hypothetical protein